MSETTNSTRTDLEYAIAKATENIKRAEKMGLKSFAQNIRRDRRAMQTKLAELA